MERAVAKGVRRPDGEAAGGEHEERRRENPHEERTGPPAEQPRVIQRAEAEHRLHDALDQGRGHHERPEQEQAGAGIGGQGVEPHALRWRTRSPRATVSHADGGRLCWAP